MAATASSGVFPPEALEANQAGRLTDVQRKRLKALARGVRKGELSTAAFLLFWGFVFFIAFGTTLSIRIRLIGGFACLFVAIFLILRSLSGGDKLTRDLRRVRVESVEGAIEKTKTYSAGGSSSATSHYLHVAGQKFEVSYAAYNAAPEAGIVRLYYLPISRHLVNLERLPDRPLPTDLTRQELANLAATAFRSRDQIERAEARAELAAMGDAFQKQFEKPATPPAVGDRDPRPLAEAIVGTWSSGMITVTFFPDGTAAATMFGGGRQSGHWSVDAAGRLVVDITGRPGAADAWIAGDELTISAEGFNLTLRRVAAT